MPTVRVTNSNDETIHHVSIIDPTTAKRALYDLMDRRADSLDSSAREAETVDHPASAEVARTLHDLADELSNRGQELNYCGSTWAATIAGMTYTYNEKDMPTEYEWAYDVDDEDPTTLAVYLIEPREYDTSDAVVVAGMGGCSCSFQVSDHGNVHPSADGLAYLEGIARELASENGGVLA